MSRADFQGRVFIFGNYGVEGLTVYVHALDPMKTGDRHSQDWVTSHFQEFSASDLKELFGLAKEGDFQVLFHGTISGQFSWDNEWDEDVDVIIDAAVPVPSDHWYYNECPEELIEMQYT